MVWYNKVAMGCGAAASRALADLMAVGRVNCVEKARRLRAGSWEVCTVEGTETELNEAMVLLGLAISDQRNADYAGAEGYAKGALRGMWSGRSCRRTLAAHVPVSDVMVSGLLTGANVVRQVNEFLVR